MSKFGWFVLIMVILIGGMEQYRLERQIYKVRRIQETMDYLMGEDDTPAIVRRLLEQHGLQYCPYGSELVEVRNGIEYRRSRADRLIPLGQYCDEVKP